MAAGDIAAPVLTGIGDVKADVPLVAVAGIGAGVLLFGARRLWAFGKSLVK